jgi:hypothetical protein
MWPFKKKKPDPRHAIHWHANLNCSFPEYQNSVPVEVLEISSRGARLQINKLQVGPYHLFVGDPSARFSLAFTLPEGTVEAPLQFVSYKLDDTQRVFLVDIDFAGMPDATKSALKKAIKRLGHTPAEEPPPTELQEPKSEASQTETTE